MLNSIKNQSFKNYEIVILDDASEDDSINIINKFISKNQNLKIKFIKQTKNLGTFASREKVLKSSSGKYILFCDADDYLEEDAVLLANDFYNDTYFSDQNACSSPRLVIWIGNRISKAKELFWDTLGDIVSRKYLMESICSSEKLLKTAICAAKHPGIREIKKDNLLVRIELPSLYDDIMDFKGNCGYFFECSIDNLQDIIPIMKKKLPNNNIYRKNRRKT